MADIELTGLPTTIPDASGRVVGFEGNNYRVYDPNIYGLASDVTANADKIQFNSDSYIYIPSDFDFSSIPASHSNAVWVISYAHDLNSATVTIPENVTLNFQGGEFSNGIINGDSTKIEASISRIFASDITTSGSWSVKNIYPQWFGALGDGVADDSGAIRRAIAFLPNRDFNLVFPKGVYIHGDGTSPRYPIVGGSYSGDVNIGSDISLTFTQKSNFSILGYGASIVSHIDNAPIRNNRIFLFDRCSNGVVKGLSIDGSISTRMPDGGDNAGYNEQSNITIDSCQNMKFIDVFSDNSVMDGFTVRSLQLFQGNDIWSEDLTFERCRGNNSYRQGGSIVNCRRAVFRDCEFSMTGTTFGTSPSFGLDFEEGFDSAFGRGQISCVVDSCTFLNNNGSGVGFHRGTRNSILKNSYFENNNIFSPQDAASLSVNNTYINNTLINSSIVTNAGGEIIRGNRLYGDGTREFMIEVRDTNNEFTNNKSRRVIIEDNFISLDTNPSVLNGSYGRLNLFASGAIYRNNRHFNVRDMSTVVFTATANNQRFLGNEWNFTGSESTGDLGNFNIVIENFDQFTDNVIDPIYDYVSSRYRPYMQIDNVGFTNKGYSIQSFEIDTMSADMAIDIFLPNTTFSLNLKTSSTFFSYDAIGVREEIFYSEGNVREIVRANGNVLRGIEVSDIFIKNGLKCITLRTRSDSSQRFNILVDIFQNTLYINSDEIFVSEPYPTSDLTTQVFRNVYAGGRVGTTAQRPLSVFFTEIKVGAEYFDTTLGYSISWNGSNWVDSTGTII